MFCGLLPTTHADELSDTVRSATASVAPSVVRIHIIAKPGATQTSISSHVTTGIAISGDGDVLTSTFGFTSNPAAVFVEDSERQRVAARIIARDHVRKLVLLKCDEGQFEQAPVSKQQWPAVGAWSVALGRLFPGDHPATSVGIVSAVGRIHGLAIQTDAKISPVNYGGPLVGLNGNILGILVPLSPSDSGEQIRAGVEWYDSGIGFAIPMPDALYAAEKLRRGKDRYRGVIGIRPSTRNPLAEEVAIDFIFPKSPAEAAGLKVGDRITKVGAVDVVRFGSFDSVVKSSYAGDLLSLSVERDDTIREFELRLAEKLERPRRGFVGFLIGAPVGTEGKPDFGIRAFTFPQTPAAAAGVPESIVLTKWNNEEIESAEDFQNRFRSTIADTQMSVGFKTDVNADEIQTAEISVTERVQTLLPSTKSIQTEIADGYESVEWNRASEDIGENGKVWYFAPKPVEDRSSGLVVLLSEAETPHEVVLNRWKDVCRTFNLLLVVPSNAEGANLTREDGDLLPLAIASVLPNRGIDVSRSVIVANKDQEELCSDLLLNPRLRQIRAAVFVECWPRVAGIPIPALARKATSILLLGGNIESRQTRALRDQSIAKLREAGAFVLQESVNPIDVESAEELIGLWSIGLKAR